MAIDSTEKETSRRKLGSVVVLLALLIVLLVLAIRLWDIIERCRAAVPSRASFQKLRKGMTLPEVEAILGPAPPFHALNDRVSFHVWRGKDGRILVLFQHERELSSVTWRDYYHIWIAWLKGESAHLPTPYYRLGQGRVYDLSFDPTLTLDDLDTDDWNAMYRACSKPDKN
jgi:hypothetical protein